MRGFRVIGLIVVGALLIMAAARATHKQLISPHLARTCGTNCDRLGYREGRIRSGGPARLAAARCVCIGPIQGSKAPQEREGYFVTPAVWGLLDGLLVAAAGVIPTALILGLGIYVLARTVRR